MNISVISGMSLLLAATWLALYKVKLARKVKRGLHDEEIRQLTLLGYLRDAMLVLLLCGIALFLLSLQDVAQQPIGSVAYLSFTNINEFSAGFNLIVGPMTYILHTVKSRKMRRLEDRLNSMNISNTLQRQSRK